MLKLSNRKEQSQEVDLSRYEDEPKSSSTFTRCAIYGLGCTYQIVSSSIDEESVHGMD